MSQIFFGGGGGGGGVVGWNSPSPLVLPTSGNPAELGSLSGLAGGSSLLGYLQIASTC